MDSSEPQTAEAWFKAGVDFQYLQFNEKQALRCFTEAINLNPGYYQAYAERGNTHRVLKNTPDALADLQRSLEIRESPSTYYIKGRILYKSGQKEEARKIMELADSLGLEDFLSYVHRAEALIDFGSKEEALVCCDQALKLEPMMANVYYLKATVLVLLSPKDALECIEQAIKLTPTVAIYYRFKACCLNALGSHQEALICCEEAMKLNINDSENYGCKAQVLVAMGKMQEALQCYDQGIRLNPTDHLNHMDKSLLLLQCGDVHGAVACYKQAIQVDPKNAVVYYNSIGCIFTDFLDPRQSIEYFDQAIGLNQNEASSFINKGSSLFIMTLYEQAAECFTQAIQLDPTIVDAHTFKGASLIFMKKHREGIACFDYAISLGIKDAGIYNNKGKVLAELGLNEEALACYNEGMEANPNDPLLYLNKAELLHKLGRDQEAVEIYSKAYGLIEIEYQKLLRVFGSEGFGDEVPRARTGLMKKLMGLQQVITETENVVAMVDAANPTVAKLNRNFNKLKEQRGKLMSKFVESLNSSKNKKFASPKDLNEQTSQVAKIEKEVIVLKQDLIEFQRSQGGGQNINNNNNNQEAEILEKHEAAEKFQNLETKNPELCNYSKTLFWTLINLFGAYKFLGTGSVHGNIGDDSTKGRLLARGAHSLANHAGEILRAGPFEEDLLTGLDNIIDSLYAPTNGNNNNTHEKMKIINKVLENKFGPDFDVSLQVAKLAFAVTKAREHSVTPHWDTTSSRVLPTTQVFKTKITLLSETVFDLVELDTKDKFSATLGLEDAVLLVTYLSKNHATITARNIPLEVQCADIVRVGGLDQLFVIGGGKKRPDEANPESCKVCNMF